MEGFHPTNVHKTERQYENSEREGEKKIKWYYHECRKNWKLKFIKKYIYISNLSNVMAVDLAFKIGPTFGLTNPLTKHSFCLRGGASHSATARTVEPPWRHRFSHLSNLHDKILLDMRKYWCSLYRFMQWRLQNL